MGAIVRELRESPQRVDEEPERAGGPGRLWQRLRSPYRGRGGGGCSEGEHYTSPENSAGGRVLSDAISYAPVLAADI